MYPLRVKPYPIVAFFVCIVKRAGTAAQGMFMAVYGKRNFAPAGAAKGLSGRPLESFGCKIYKTGCKRLRPDTGKGTIVDT